MKFEFLKPTKKQNTEFGMVAALIIILLALYKSDFYYVKAALILIVLTIVFPYIFSPITSCWIAVSEILGRISSAILLGLIFIVIVLPIGLYRKWTRLDNLKLREFKRGDASVLTERNHVYSEQDLLHTF